MRQLLSRYLWIVRWMMMIWMDWGDMNKHFHAECVVFEDMIIMMERDKIVWLKVTRVRWMMMMSGRMIDTNRYDGVVFPISMRVRELELRLQRMWRREMRMDGREEGRELREVSGEKTPFGKEVSLLLLREWREWVWWWMKWNEDGKGFEVDIVVEYVWRKGGELIGIEVHERREERNKE